MPTMKKKPTTGVKRNDPVKVAKYMAERAKQFASRALSSTVKIFKKTKKTIVPVTSSTDDNALSLNSIMPIFESNKHARSSKSGRKKGGKSSRNRSLKKRGKGGTCSSLR